MGMFSCYYFALVGSFPTRAECEKLGGCKKCRFYLEEPVSKDKEERTCSE